MAFTPATINAFDPGTVDAAEVAIDKMVATRGLDVFKHGNQYKLYFDKHPLNFGARQELVRRYRKAGWKQVSLGENGDQRVKGLVLIVSNVEPYDPRDR